MAAETFTVANLLTHLTLILEGNTTADTTKRATYVWMLQAAMRELVLDTDHPAFIEQNTLTLVAGTASYALADKFRKLIEPSMVFTTNSKNTIKYFDFQTHDRQQLDAYLGSGRPKWVTINKCDPSTGLWSATFWPTPAAADTVRYRHFVYPTQFDTDSNGTTTVDQRFPAAFKNAIVSGALLNFPDILTPQEMQAHLRIFESAKRQFKLDSMKAVGQSYGMAKGEIGSLGPHWYGNGTVGSPWNSGSAREWR